MVYFTQIKHPCVSDRKTQADSGKVKGKEAERLSDRLTDKNGLEKLITSFKKNALYSVMGKIMQNISFDKALYEKLHERQCW